MNSRTAVERLVFERAGNRCEYCRMHQALQGATFHIEHIVPSSGGGDSEPTNLALACPGCNLRKSDRTTVIDPLTGQTVFLFHPRRQMWHEHFRWQEMEIVGLTAIGRATVATLEMNHTRRLRIRQAEALFQLWPPDDSAAD